MDNDDAIVGTILSRRTALGLVAKAGLGAALGGLFVRDAHAALQVKARREVKLVASPAVTEGPFYVDEKLERADLRAGTTRASVVEAVPLLLAVTVYRLKDGHFAPLPGAVVDVWHADAHGVYSDESAPMNHENTSGQNWLRGYQKTDEKGVARFETVFPGWYMSRTTHIHFKVREAAASGTATKEFTSQLFFDDALADRIFAQAPYRVRDEEQTRNADDMVYTERQVDGTKAGEHLMLEIAPAKAGKGYEAKFAVALNDESFRAGGRGHRGGPGGPPPGGFGGPPPDEP